MASITVARVEVSTTVETIGAVDAEVEVEGRGTYTVTLLPSEYDGTLSRWGQVDHWLSGPGVYGHEALPDLDAIEEAVREAARLLDTSDGRLYGEDGLTEAGALLARRVGLTVDVDAYGHAFARGVG